jgi:hypothetical protein
MDAKDARASATTEVEGAKANARAAEAEARRALGRAQSAHVTTRLVTAPDASVSPQPNGLPPAIDVPPAVLERLQLDSSAVAALGTLVRLKDTVIVRQDRLIAADTLEVIATAKAFRALERLKEPRCGRRCGIALGVGGMIAAAVAVEQVRRMVR